MQKWVHQVTPAVKEAIHHCKKCLKQQTHDIRDFFTLKKKKTTTRTKTQPPPEEPDNTQQAAEGIEVLPRNQFNEDGVMNDTTQQQRVQQQQQRQTQQRARPTTRRGRRKTNRRWKTHRPCSMSNTTLNADTPT